MQVGGLRRIVIPPALAYGLVPLENVPAYSTLIFEVLVQSIEIVAGSRSDEGLRNQALNMFTEPAARRSQPAHADAEPGRGGDLAGAPYRSTRRRSPCRR